MIEKLTDWLIARRLRKSHIVIPHQPSKNTPQSRIEFMRVLNTLRENKVMVVTKEDGIYVRMAGDENKGECFSLEFTKVKSF